MSATVADSGSSVHSQTALGLFARPALGFAASTFVAVALMLLVSMVSG